MNIVVIVKETFDTEEKVTVQNGRIQEDGVEFIMNPYDEYAMEEAIRLKEKHGGEVTVMTVGPARAENVLRTALAMGADRAVIVDDETAAGDEFTISKVLAAVIRRQEPFDLILAGHVSIDHGSSQIGPRLAEELDVSLATAITGLVIAGSRATAVRDAEGDLETIELPLPLLVTAQQGLNEPRYPSLPSMMKAKKKPIERLGIADLGLTPDDVRPKTAVVDYSPAPKKEAGRRLTGELDAQAKELAQLLRHEAKVL
jgi:electron transfer flavoprotein beta subunit